MERHSTTLSARRAWILAAAILVLSALVAAATAFNLDPTTDERLYLRTGVHLLAGGTWDHWLTRFQGPFGFYFNQIFAGGLDDAALKTGDHSAPVQLGRLGMVPFGTLIGLLVFVWSRRVWGDGTGLFCLALCALHPLVIGYSALIPVDIVHAATTLLAVYLVWRYAQRPRYATALGVGVAVGLALGTKYLAVVLVPSIGAVLLACPGPARPAGRFAAALNRLLAALLAALATYVVLHAVYQFRVDFAPSTADGYASSIFQTIARTPLLDRLLFWLPEPYALGIDGRLAFDESGRGIYAMGTFGPQADYFLWAFALKTPDLVVALFLVVVPVALVRLLRGGMLGEERSTWLVVLACVVPPLTILSVFVGFKIGVRYALQYLPPLFVLLGSVRGLAQALIPATRARVAAALFVVAYVAFEDATSWPNLIAYYNRASGGKASAYHYFRDSNSDWAQYLTRGEALLRETESEPFNVARGADGPRFGRTAIYVSDLASRDRYHPGQAWHWLLPFTPIRNVEAAWWLFDVEPEEWEQAARGQPRIAADLALAYLVEGRSAEARPHISASPEPLRTLMSRYVELRERYRGTEVDVAQAVELARQFMNEDQPDIACMLLRLENVDTNREGTFQLAIALRMKRRPEEAVEVLKADEALCRTWRGFFDLAQLLLKAGRFPEVRVMMEENAQFKETHPQRWRILDKRFQRLEDGFEHNAQEQ